MNAVVDLTIRRKIFPGHEPLFENLSVQLRAGERVALMGPSGVGKTTLLAILAGLDSSFDGSRRHAGGRPRLGIMFQAPRLMPWLTVRQNVALVVRNRHASRSVESLLDAVELRHVQDAYPRELSGGMQRRVGLARAVANDPQLLILDEPFVSLDDALSVRLYEQILDALPPTTTVVMATHDWAEAATLADRILVLAGRPVSIAGDHLLPAPRPRSAETVAAIAAQLRAEFVKP